MVREVGEHESEGRKDGGLNKDRKDGQGSASRETSTGERGREIVGGTVRQS